MAQYLNAPTAGEAWSKVIRAKFCGQQCYVKADEQVINHVEFKLKELLGESVEVTMVQTKDGTVFETKPVAVDDGAKSVTLGDETKHIPRPRNSFMLFRQHHHPLVKERFPKLKNTDISKVISQLWAKADSAEKKHWQDEADRVKAQHYALHPDYVYQPRKPGQKKRRMTKKMAARAQAAQGQAAQGQVAQGQAAQGQAAQGQAAQGQVVQAQMNQDPATAQVAPALAAQPPVTQPQAAQTQAALASLAQIQAYLMSVATVPVAGGQADSNPADGVQADSDPADGFQADGNSADVFQTDNTSVESALSPEYPQYIANEEFGFVEDEDDENVAKHWTPSTAIPNQAVSFTDHPTNPEHRMLNINVTYPNIANHVEQFLEHANNHGFAATMDVTEGPACSATAPLPNSFNHYLQGVPDTPAFDMNDYIDFDHDTMDISIAMDTNVPLVGPNNPDITQNNEDTAQNNSGGSIADILANGNGGIYSTVNDIVDISHPSLKEYREQFVNLMLENEAPTWDIYNN